MIKAIMSLVHSPVYLNQLFIEPEKSLGGAAQRLSRKLLQINGSVASLMREVMCQKGVFESVFRRARAVSHGRDFMGLIGLAGSISPIMSRY